MKPMIWFMGAGFCLVSLFATPIFHNFVSPQFSHQAKSIDMVQELDRVGLLPNLSQKDLTELIQYQEHHGLNLAQILKDPVWRKKLGLTSTKFKATWYMSNPFDVLPPALQEKIAQLNTPFIYRNDVWRWCRQNGISKNYRKALYAALIETTPNNLWRASRGQKPITKSGRFLEPIVVDLGNGQIEIKDGHIATDPLVIPTNSDVLLIVKIDGVDRILKVRAADTGAAIKGYHVDLPIHVGPESKTMPYTLLPKDKIRNPSVEILIPSQPNQDQKV